MPAIAYAVSSTGIMRIAYAVSSTGSLRIAYAVSGTGRMRIAYATSGTEMVLCPVLTLRRRYAAARVCPALRITYYSPPKLIEVVPDSVPIQGMVLRVGAVRYGRRLCYCCHAMCGTDIGYAATVLTSAMLQ
eukprot:1524817-Rhodomonas_salina.1